LEVRWYRGVRAHVLVFAVSVGIRTNQPSTLIVARASMMIYRQKHRRTVIVAWTVNILQLSVKYRWPQAVGMIVDDCEKYSKYFATLDKIPTDGFCQYGRRYLWQMQ